METIKWKIGDTVRHEKFTEPMIITNLYTEETGGGHYFHIDHFASLTNKDNTIKGNVKTFELWSEEMSEEECLGRFNASFIYPGGKNITEAITYYQNVTGDKVLNVNYDVVSESVTLITKKFGVSILKKNI